MPETKQTATKPPKMKRASAAAKERLAAALRENLRRRKVQERAREAGEKGKPG